MRQKERVKITKIIAHNLSVLREKRGLSVIDLAKKCSVTRQAIYNLQDGVSIPTPKLADKLSRALDIEEHELFQLNTTIK